jgi:rubrerythrin
MTMEDARLQKLLTGVLLVGAALGGVNGVRMLRDRSKGVGNNANFLRYAITLEAQQVPLYRSLRAKARKQRCHHIEAGLAKAMVVEQDHYYRLEEEAERLGLAVWPWYVLGTGLGYISGALLTMFPLSTALKTVVVIETKAAKDYEQAGQVLHDERLKAVYLDHQVDEESHYSWAREILHKYW